MGFLYTILHGKNEKVIKRGFDDVLEDSDLRPAKCHDAHTFRLFFGIGCLWRVHVRPGTFFFFFKADFFFQRKCFSCVTKKITIFGLLAFLTNAIFFFMFY